jgi:hypothetical protein
MDVEFRKMAKEKRNCVLYRMAMGDTMKGSCVS